MEKKVQLALKKILARDTRDPNLKDSTKASELTNWANRVENAGGFIEYYKNNDLENDKKQFAFFTDPEASSFVKAIEDFLIKSEALSSAVTGLIAKYGAKGKFEY